MQPKVCPRRGENFVMNRQELLGFFLQKRRINTIFCGECQKDECYNCKRFYYIRNQLEKNAFFEKQIGPKSEPWPHQPILWQVFDNFLKEPNNLDKNTYKFRIYIHKTVSSNFLVKRYDFKNDKIIEIFNE